MDAAVLPGEKAGAAYIVYAFWPVPDLWMERKRSLHKEDAPVWQEEPEHRTFINMCKDIL